MEKYFQGAEEFSFRDLGRSMHFFSGIKGAHFFRNPGSTPVIRAKPVGLHKQSL